MNKELKKQLKRHITKLQELLDTKPKEQHPYLKTQIERLQKELENLKEQKENTERKEEHKYLKKKGLVYYPFEELKL